MIPVVIQAVPWDDQRATNARHLADITGGTVVWDHTHSPFTTFREALREFADGPGILLEDDVTLAPNWRDRVESVVSDHPLDVVRFFSYYSRDRELGSRRMPGHTYSQNQCVYFPSRLAHDFVTYTNTRWQGSVTAEMYHDIIFGRFLTHRRQDYWLHVPSLVQHLPLPSAVSPTRRTRTSPTFEEAA